MRTAIVGVGGVGGFFGGILARHADVTFVARGEQFEALRRSGLHVKTRSGDFHVPEVKVVRDCGELDEPDLVLFCVKSYDTIIAARSLKQVVREDTVVLPIQNGIDNDLRLKSLIGAGEVHSALAHIVSEKIAPGSIRQTAGTCELIFGDRSNGHNEKLQAVASFMCAHGLNVRVSESIEREIWRKYLFILAFAGMTGVYRCSIGTILDEQKLYDLYKKVVEEALQVARAVGIELDDDTYSYVIDRTEHYRTNGPQAKSSLLRDLEAGRQTEIEALSGTIVSMARSIGREAPLNSMIYDSIATLQ